MSMSMRGEDAGGHGLEFVHVLVLVLVPPGSEVERRPVHRRRGARHQACAVAVGSALQLRWKASPRSKM